ncbi:hypothetical protein HYU14_07685 [Candidatus Woesearchaeota archaeon]|nr:hypothetical protein [Candidatus Woesearchaeota archaeon]
MTDFEDLIKAGMLLILGAILISTLSTTTLLSKELAQSFVNLGNFLIIMAIFVAIISLLVPFLKRLLD